ncbi:MAG: S41 family peptidase [Lachnospiraceae bacterium]|nr:S41 family peptidase [Lachnospiraceae bacterium]
MISVILAMAVALSLSACNVVLPDEGEVRSLAEEGLDLLSEASYAGDNAPEEPADIEEKAPVEITAKDMTWYLCDMEDTRTLPVYFAGDSDVPYVSLEDWAELYPYLLKKYVHLGSEELAYGLSYSKEGETGTLTRTDGDPYNMIVDCDADTITFFDYDAFQRLEADRVLIDVLEADSAHSEEEESLFRRTGASYERYGDPLVLDAGAYGIDLVADDKGVYVPIQTLSDFLLSLKYINLFYNGDAIFFASYGGLGDGLSGERTPFGDLFYSAEKRQISKAMGGFGYNELCMVFDYLYGLKEVHGIKCFDDLAQQAGAKEILMGPDPNAADEALYRIIFTHLDDLHSTFGTESAWSRDGLGKELLDQIGIGRSYISNIEGGRIYDNARAEAFPDGVPAYQEVGNTAYITFDEFLPIPEGVNYYETAPTAEAKDTIGIMIYAYSQIMREGSPIENVVLDLSNNGGGDADTAVFVISTFLGDGYGSLKNTMTGALATGVYNVDVNLDHHFDEKDRGLTGKKHFCLTTASSFSCGNFVPCVFQNSGRVTLLGRTSGGGSCVVLPLTTAYGTFFRISGPSRLAFTKNGSFYDIDQGAEPDIFLAFPESFYDREGLTEMINDLR